MLLARAGLVNRICLLCTQMQMNVRNNQPYVVLARVRTWMEAISVSALTDTLMRMELLAKAWTKC